jgi:hypothetical protein
MIALIVLVGLFVLVVVLAKLFGSGGPGTRSSQGGPGDSGYIPMDPNGGHSAHHHTPDCGHGDTGGGDAGGGSDGGGGDGGGGGGSD